jgi:hypothetical protein
MVILIAPTKPAIDPGCEESSFSGHAVATCHLNHSQGRQIPGWRLVFPLGNKIELSLV